MNYIKSFKLFESQEPIDIIRDIFTPIRDYTVVKINQYDKIPEYDNKQSIHISMNFDSCVSDETAISKWGQKYRPIKDDSLISIILAEIFDTLLDNSLFSIKKTQVYWLEVGESKSIRDKDIKKGGPGLLTKDFEKFDDIADFIESRGNRLRQVRMVLLVNDVNESNRIYESQNSIVSDINEIFLSEIKDIDDGYNIEIYDYNDVLDSNLGDKIDIEISKCIVQNGTIDKRIPFEIQEIEDGIHRILNYMSDIGYDNYITAKLWHSDWIILVMKEGNYTRYKLEPYEWRLDKPILRVKIKFTK